MWANLLTNLLTAGIPALVRAIKARRRRRGKRDFGVTQEDVNKVTDPFLRDVVAPAAKKLADRKKLLN